MAENHSHAVAGTKTFLWVWTWLVVLTILEVILAYRAFSLVMMIVILVGLSLMKSFLIMAYFMHLKFEKRSLVMTLIPATVILLCLMFIAFPDAVRIQQMVPR